MRRWLSAAAAAVALVLASTGAVLAQEDVANTVHNLSVSSGGTDPTTGAGITDWGEICVYCHTPHTNQAPEAVLWNRGQPAGPFTMYDQTFSPTIDMTVASTPQGVSLNCLSCHDGTVGLDNIVNEPGQGEDGPTAPTDSTMPPGITLLGTNLTGEHPISVTYDPLDDPQFVDTATVKATLPLYGSNADQVECGSCHNPHEGTLPTFLRISNASSDLCLTCHSK